MNLKYLASHADQQIGEVYYLVDSDYRTQAQGWFQADHTGPGDLYLERNPGSVFRTGDYSSDAVAAQAALDAMVDYRGDLLKILPGSLSIATALAMNVESGRINGPKRAHPRSTMTTITDAVGNAVTVSASNVELGHFKAVPKTAKAFLKISSGNFGHIHDVFYNTNGVTGSTSTEFCNGAASTDWTVERFHCYVDDAQGDAFTLASSERWIWQDSDFLVALDNVAWASVFTFTTSALGNIARRLYFRGCGGTTAAVFTKIFTGIANVNGQLMIANCIVDGTALATATDIETTFGTTTDVELAENYQTGDATTEGGTLVKLA